MHDIHAILLAHAAHSERVDGRHLDIGDRWANNDQHVVRGFRLEGTRADVRVTAIRERALRLSRRFPLKPGPTARFHTVGAHTRARYIAIAYLLRHYEWSDRMIAKGSGGKVSAPTVGRVRSTLERLAYIPARGDQAVPVLTLGRRSQEIFSPTEISDGARASLEPISPKREKVVAMITDAEFAVDAERLAECAAEILTIAARFQARFPASSILADTIDKFISLALDDGTSLPRAA